MSTNLDAALAHAARGWRVVPVPPGRKVPTLTAWQERATTDADLIGQWWTAHPDHGISIVTGAASDIWVLDVDVANGKAGDETLAELEAAYGPLPDTYTVITGSGGEHRYFRWNPAHPVRNNQSGRLGPGLDVRGEGGQVVAPPSVHANGRTYEQDLGTGDEVADAPAWLLAMVEDQVDEQRERPVRPLVADEGTPGARWAQTTTWDDLLTRDGWTKLRPGPQGEDRWTRPGKDQRDGPSATVGYGGSDVLKVFSSSVGHLGLRAEETYTRFGYLAATRFGGDHAAAASWLRSQGHGDATPDDALADELGLTTLADLPPIVEQPDPGDAEPWGEPTPWMTKPVLPAFPLETLPEWTRAHVVAAAEARQVPVDLCAMLAIGALSAAATGRATVWPALGWEEPVNLYLTVAMRSGAGKSPAEKAMVGWLRTWERERIDAMRDAHDEAELLARAAEKRYKKAQEAGIMGDDDLRDAARQAKDARERVTPLPRLIIDDTTPEAVAVLLAGHDERLAILSTEADLFDLLLRGNPGQRASMNVYLKAWSGDELRRDRKGGSETGPEGTFLVRPLLTVSVTVQPAVLSRVLTDPEMVSRGFAARFMFSMPDDLMGRRDQRLRFRSGALRTAEAYEAQARALATRWATWARPADLYLAADASTLFEDFLVELEPHLAEDGALGALAEWVAKLVASVARYAGLLHLADGNDPHIEVSAETMARALELGRYWLSHAHAVVTTAEDDATRQAKILLEWIAAQGVGEVALTDLQKGCRRPGEGLDKAGDYVSPVSKLIDHGWLRPVGAGDWRASVGVKRAASPNFAVLPSVVGMSPGAVYSRSSRIASKGECFSLSSLSPPTPFRAHAIRELRDLEVEPFSATHANGVGGEGVDATPAEGEAVDDAWDIFGAPA